LLMSLLGVKVNLDNIALRWDVVYQSSSPTGEDGFVSSVLNLSPE
jgi:hypothetical protein